MKEIPEKSGDAQRKGPNSFSPKEIITELAIYIPHHGAEYGADYQRNILFIDSTSLNILLAYIIDQHSEVFGATLKIFSFKAMTLEIIYFLVFSQKLLRVKFSLRVVKGVPVFTKLTGDLY
ncbi:hypothetical protein E5288_WYG013163 [Bos mutus]|uniref:Uncharacterized protein n=1 Tax=Bos mutus TaxID=72004 RepID=A0A6B0RZ74_9CETA|nr:hypothetical protein [Bos mutus]